MFGLGKKRGKTGRSFRNIAEDMVSEGVRKRIARENVDVTGLEVDNRKGQVVLRGVAKSQADADRALRAARNAPGFSGVQSEIKIEGAQAAEERRAGDRSAPERGAQPHAPQETLYTVKSGDTLSKIALTYYGDASKYPAIFEANRPLLKDPDRIFPGQVLKIPSLAKA